ncbi:NAC domain containing protein 52-like [Malania oleifera]|uniref:NAC domain containing protein 52-like n=1 Tax=Malania oleifera TaxID=397392 RepID=UPI0025AE5D24|nr:NAC domain containing protein 52-like [Malania oleifera]
MGRETPPSPPPATSLAPGFRFHPTDEELVRYYLKRKVSGKSFRFDAVSEADIYKSEPWDLPGKSRLKSRDLEWYFFGALDKKYGNGARMNRATNKGYWKTTGKDRAVRHKSRIVGMKKTLVFHSGRAPGGERTNWVMHEYRLVDEELERAGIAQDAFVLCRIFQKSGLGPPNGDRYAPFIEEEWDNDASVLVPGEEGGDEEVGGDDACVEGIDLERDISQSVKTESLEDCPPLSLAAPEPFPILPKKRSRENDPEPGQSNASENTTMTAHDRSSSTTTATAAATTTTAKTPMMTTTTRANFSTTLLEFPLLETIDRRDSPPVNLPTFNPGSMTPYLPPAYMKLFSDLRNEIHNISAEKAAFKIELMSAQAMINILQSRIDFLGKENEELRRSA